MFTPVLDLFADLCVFCLNTHALPQSYLQGFLLLISLTKLFVLPWLIIIMCVASILLLGTHKSTEVNSVHEFFHQQH